MQNEGKNLEEVPGFTKKFSRGGSLLVYTKSKVIEMVELESSQQCFLNPHKYSELPNIVLDDIM